MKSTDDQGLIPVIVASEADSTYIRTIPTAQATTGDGSVSLDLGLPPECATAVAAGGKRPEMKDMNGIWNLFSRAIQSLQAYRGVYSASFATAIGGYPEYALVSDSSGNYWISTADDNVTVPGADGASWAKLQQPGRRNIISFTQSQNWTVPSGVTNIFAKFWGAGGAGGLGVNNGAGAGGNGGQFVEVSLAVSPGQSIWISVGAGGAPSSVAGTEGTAGGDSTVAGIAARGGTPGGEGNGTYGLSNANRPAAAVSNGIALAGGGGTNAILFQTGSYSTYQAGVGGGSPGGGNIAFSGVVGSTGESTGSTGAYPGGGGGGGINERGGYGADGLVLIEY